MPAGHKKILPAGPRLPDRDSLVKKKLKAGVRNLFEVLFYDVDISRRGTSELVTAHRIATSEPSINSSEVFLLQVDSDAR